MHNARLIGGTKAKIQHIHDITPPINITITPESPNANTELPR